MYIYIYCVWNFIAFNANIMDIFKHALMEKKTYLVRGLQPQMDVDWTALTLYGTMVFQPISWDVTPIAMIMYYMF